MAGNPLEMQNAEDWNLEPAMNEEPGAVQLAAVNDADEPEVQGAAVVELQAEPITALTDLPAEMICRILFLIDNEELFQVGFKMITHSR